MANRPKTTKNAPTARATTSTCRPWLTKSTMATLRRCTRRSGGSTPSPETCASRPETSRGSRPMATACRSPPAARRSPPARRHPSRRRPATSRLRQEQDDGEEHQQRHGARDERDRRRELGEQPRAGPADDREDAEADRAPRDEQQQAVADRGDQRAGQLLVEDRRQQRGHQDEPGQLDRPNPLRDRERWAAPSAIARRQGPEHQRQRAKQRGDVGPPWPMRGRPRRRAPGTRRTPAAAQHA